jgi:hypothetical protein
MKKRATTFKKKEQRKKVLLLPPKNKKKKMTVGTADECCPWKGALEGPNARTCADNTKDYSSSTCDTSMDKYCRIQDRDFDSMYRPASDTDGTPVFTKPNLFRADMCGLWMTTRKEFQGTLTLEDACKDRSKKVYLDDTKTKIGYAMDLPECSCVRARENFKKAVEKGIKGAEEVPPECISSDCLMNSQWKTATQEKNPCQVVSCKMEIRDLSMVAGDDFTANYTQACGQKAGTDAKGVLPSATAGSKNNNTRASSTKDGSGSQKMGVIVGVSVIAVGILAVGFMAYKKKMSAK